MHSLTLPRLFIGISRLMWWKGELALTFSRFANINALQEIYRVLQPTGRLGMIWNIEDCKSSARRGAVSMLIES